MTTRLLELGVVMFHFLRTRALRFRTRDALLAWQRGQIDLFLRKRLRHAPYYQAYAGQPLSQLPIMDKPTMLANFSAVNSVGLGLKEATATALAGEATRDFRPQVGDVTVGLSSGTQGPRGVFLVSRREQLKWAGIMLARVLDGKLLRQLLPGRPPLKVAFFMRANSNLYGTLASRRIDFRFYDLLGGIAQHLAALQEQTPDILVAPSRILGRIAALALDGQLRLAPRKVIAVAEVLEPDDRRRIEQAFGGPVHQLYQCTEGFLGYTCEHGTLHLNEEFVHIEREWLDAERTRFVPIVTDFTRSTQYFVRYRLNDVLRVRAEACPCGHAAMALETVEGRCDDILWLPARHDGGLAALYPDTIRHAISIAPQTLPDYRVEQHGALLHIAVADGLAASFDGVAQALRQAAVRQGLRAPECRPAPFVEAATDMKRRRILCAVRPAASDFSMEGSQHA